MREEMPPTPAPDVVRFDRDDYQLPILGLCAICLGASWSAANPVRPTNLRGLAADVEGCRIITPEGRSMLWRSGDEIPAGGDWLADLARLFGDRVTWTEGPGHPLPMLAVTAIDGTLSCALHAHPNRDTFRQQGSRRP